MRLLVLRRRAAARLLRLCRTRGFIITRVDNLIISGGCKSALLLLLLLLLVLLEGRGLVIF